MDTKISHFGKYKTWHRPQQHELQDYNTHVVQTQDDTLHTQPQGVLLFRKYIHYNTPTCAITDL